jgi:uncharacterized membrane protein
MRAPHTNKAPRLRIFGSPVHPPLTYVPATFLLTGPLCDLAATRTGSKDLAKAGYWQQLVATVMVPAVALTGLLDWLRLPSDAPGKGMGAVHALLNYLAAGLTGWHLLKRRAKPQDAGRIDPRVSASILGIVAVSAHLGGELAYRHGIRVEKSQPLREGA